MMYTVDRLSVAVKLPARKAGPSVFDLPVSGRPGGVRGSGREGKTKNKKRRGPSPRMPTDLLQEGCNGCNGRVTDVTVV